MVKTHLNKQKDWLAYIKKMKRFILIVLCTFSATYFQYSYSQSSGHLRISGVISIAETGESLPGVNIIVQGSSTGTISKLDGSYSISVPDANAILVYSFLGFQSQEVKVGNQKVINIKLKEDSKTLEMVVVVGYGQQKKESVVGSIVQAKGEQLRTTMQGADLSNSLTGQLPGLVAIQTTGIPGGVGEDDEPTKLLIRGQSTWNNAEPLVLVDGIERSLRNVDASEIESISVLKDASATAVFGVKGANGVIMITTRRGIEGRPQLSFDFTSTLKTVSKVVRRLGSYEANLLKNYAIENEVSISENSWNQYVPEQWLDYYRTQEFPELFPDIDWVDEFTKKFAKDQKLNMTLSGGTDFLKYFGSFSYLHEGDIVSGNNYGQGYTPSYKYDRFNFRSNLDFNVSKTTKLSANLSGIHSTQFSPGGNKWDIWRAMYNRPPDLYPPRYSDGVWADYSGYDRFFNSLVSLNFGGLSKTNTTQVNTDFLIRQELDFLLNGLSAQIKFSYDNTFITRGTNVSDDGVLLKWIDPRAVEDIVPGMSQEELHDIYSKYTIFKFPQTASNSHGYYYVDQSPSYSPENSTNNVFRKLDYQFSINYNRNFGKHEVGALALMSRMQSAMGSEFSSFREDWVSRFTYNYGQKYFIEFNGAYNGSEKFDKKYRFGFFPSGALGWLISNEDFFKPIKHFVNNLKLRYSNGVVGSDAGIERWLYVGSWNVLAPGSKTRWEFGSPYLRPSPYTWRLEGTIPNPDIHWEVAQKENIGIETGFFKNILTFNFDYFWESRKDIFLSGSELIIPDYFGAAPVSRNSGEVKIHGWEFEMKFSKTTNNFFNYWFSHNWSFAKDVIVNRGDPELMPDYQKQAGYSIDQPRLLINQNQIINNWNDVYSGVLVDNRAQVLPGDFRQIDFNSDGVIDNNDRIPYGFPSRPQFTYAPSFGLNYKGVGASARFYGVYNVAGNANLYYREFFEQYSVVYPWHKENAWSPQLGISDEANYHGLRYITNSSPGGFGFPRYFFRLQHAEISYQLKPSFLKRVGASSMRFVISGDNLFMWSPMDEDMDAPSSSGRSYPKLKRYNLGVNLTF